MSAVVSRAAAVRALPGDRRERILDAAEACFVRSGFDRTTMNDLAREAAMSPANLYRYFDSKEALVAGLVGREVERGTALVEALQRDGDAEAELLGVVDQYYLRISRDTAILRLDIWSEATRNPVIGELMDRVERDGRPWMDGLLARLAASPDCDLAALRAALDALMKGMVVGRALLADFDPEPMGRHFRAVLKAGLAARLAPGAETRG